MKKLYPLLLLFVSSICFGQQYHNFSLNQENQFVFNPAVAGTDEYFDIGASFRKQWFNIDQAPYSVYMGAESPIKYQDIGLGGFIIQDATGPISQTAFNFSFAYHIDFGRGYKTQTQDIRLDKSLLSFGFGLNLVQYRLDGTKIELDDETDELFLNKRGARFNPDINFGIYYKSKWVYAGISVPQLLGLNINMSENGREVNIKKGQHLYAQVGVRIPITTDHTWFLEPSVWFKTSFQAPHQEDINIRVEKQDIAWLGVGYRTRQNLSFQGGFWINKAFNIGYAYDLPISNYRPDLGQTHEIYLGYRFIPNF